MHTKTYVFKTFDKNRSIETTIHYGNTSGSKAIALGVHGGGFCIGSRKDVPSGQIEYLVKNNFVVVTNNYRLCPNIPMYDGPMQDTKDAWQWCRTTLPSLLKSDLNFSADCNRIVVFGHSAGATLAMMLGHETPRPRAILCSYGALYLRDPSWIEPRKSLPSFDESFGNKVFEAPVVTHSKNFVGDTESLGTGDRADKQLNTGNCPIDYDAVRIAFVMGNIRNGQLFPKLFGEDFDKHDPAVGFSKDFPPTYFAHGDADIICRVEISKRAKKELDGHGVETGMLIMKGGEHGFDMGIGEGDKGWKEKVQGGLDFLIDHVQEDPN